MTDGRWDTRKHIENDVRRCGPNGKPRDPWHDATSALEGPVAAKLGELCRERWKWAGAEKLEAVVDGEGCWPAGLDVDFEDAEIGIVRTLPEHDDRAATLEIEALYLSQIAEARRFLYIESQYFASRRVAEAIARRLDEPDGPEIVVINPVSAQGWLEPLAMDSARSRIDEALSHRLGYARFRIYHPHTDGGTPIYVHAKILIGDDRIIRVGSSNLNNRSMRLDTECDIVINAPQQDNPTLAKKVEEIRNGLIAEHLGLEFDQVAAEFARTGSMIATIDGLRTRKNQLRPYERLELGDVESWIADDEVLDPESPDEMFEPLNGKGLLRGRLSLRGRFRRKRH